MPLWLCHTAKAQQSIVRFQHYTTRQGLSSDILYDIAQDKKGWLWISTPVGLNRFNGTGFTQFTHDEKDITSLPSDKSRIATDKEGNLWVYSEMGLHWYNDSTEDFVHLNGTQNQPIAAIGFGIKNAIWFCTEDGWLWKAKNRTAVAVKMHQFEGVGISAITQDRQNRLWLVTDDGLLLYNEKNNSAKVYKDLASGAINNYFSLFEDYEGQLWVSSWGDGLKWFEPATGRFTSYRFNADKNSTDIQNFAAAIIQPDNTRPELWISAVDPQTGISVFNTITRTFIRTFKHDPQVPGSPSSNASICIFKDNSGIIWFASEKGLDQYDPMANRFEAIQLNEIPGCGTDPGITSMATINQQLWVGTSDKGVLVLDSSGKKLLLTLDLSKTSGHPESNYIGGFCTVKNGQMLIGTYMGAFTCDITTYKTTPIKPFENTNVSTIFRYFSSGGYWFATTEGLVRMDSTLLTVQDTLLSGTSVYSLYQQKDGTVWIGTSMGLFAWAKDKLKKIEKEAENYKKLAASRVFDIEQDGRGNLLLATSFGTMVYNPLTQEISVYSKQNGLAHNACYAIEATGDEICWVLNEKGISEINTKNGNIKNYGDAQGASAPTYANGLLYKNNDGHLFFGRYISLYHFDPNGLAVNNFRAPVYITSIRLGDSVLAADNLKQGRALAFSYINNSISIEYALLNYSNSEGNTYEYKLEGSAQNGWTQAGTRNYITYPGLPPGKYVFKVRGKNSDGVFSSNEATLNFEVVPPFWQTLWFRLLAVTGLILTIAGIIRARFQAIRQKAAIRHQMLEAEVKALRAQMNPHFIFNCMNTIDSYILQNKQLQASQLVQRFSKLTRRVLEHTSQAYITLADEMETLRIYLQIERMRQAEGFEFEINMADETTRLWVPPMLVQPFVENAVIHGIRNRQAPGGRITISSILEGSQIKITVQDNGIGRVRAMEIKAALPTTHQSISMELTLSRLEALHGHKKHNSYLIFTDLTAPETGTKVDIYVPVRKGERTELRP